MVSQIFHQLQHLSDDKKRDSLGIILSMLFRLRYESYCISKHVFSWLFPVGLKGWRCTWFEMGHTSTATPLFLDMSLASGWRDRANPWPIRDVFRRRASIMFWSTSVPSWSSGCQKESEYEGFLLTICIQILPLKIWFICNIRLCYVTIKKGCPALFI